jgi:uncharacterized UBP type Zn finger protein
MLDSVYPDVTEIPAFLLSSTKAGHGYDYRSFQRDRQDMGFPADKSRRALNTTESGTDVQAAVGWLLTQAHSVETRHEPG